MKIEKPKKLFGSSNDDSRFATTMLVAGTTRLRQIFGDDVDQYLVGSYSLTVVCTVLLDLLIKSQGETFSSAEVTQHVEVVIIEELQLASEQSPTFQTEPTQSIVAELYQILLEHIWPLMAHSPLMQISARIALVNYEILQVTTTRVRSNDART